MNTKNILLIILGAIIAVPLSVSALSVFTPSQGGTGNGNIPTYGQILVGNGSAYTLTATSSLGLPTNATLANYLTLSAWYATTTGGLAEGSNLYYTSARATSSFNSLIGALDKGYFFSTTSADAWKLTKDFWATTSADYWYTLQSKASSTLLGDTNTWSGANVFSNALSTFAGTAAKATILATARTINGVSFDGSANITVTAASSTLLGDNNLFTSLSATNATITRATTTNLSVTNAPTFASLTGILKGNGASPLTVAANGTDYTLVGAQTCSAGSFISALTASGGSTCTAGNAGTVTAVNGTYPVISSGGATPAISLAFGTTTSNLWAGKQTFTNAPIFSSLTGLLKGNGAGELTVATAGTDYVNGSGTSGNCVAWGASNSLTDAGAPCGSGTGGGGASQWATSTLFTSTIHTAGAYGVGIGTTTPFGALTLASSSAVTQWFNHTGASANSRLGWSSFANGVLSFGTSSYNLTSQTLLSLNGGTTTVNAAVFAVTNGANTSRLIAGTGTSTPGGGIDIPSGCFAVSGSCMGVMALSGSVGQVNYYSGVNTAVGTSSLFIATSQNIGVGSTSPWAKLSIDTNTTTGTYPLFAVASSSLSMFVILPNGNIGVDTTMAQHKLDVRGRIAGQPTFDCMVLFMSQTNVTADQLGSATVASFACEGNMFVDVNTANAGILALSSANVEAPMASGTPAVQLLDASIATPSANNLVFLKTHVLGSATSSLGRGLAMQATIRTPKVSTATTSVTYVPLAFSDAAITSLTTTAAYALPSNGCALVASSTPNWKLQCRKASATVLVDTGFATSTTAFKALLTIDSTGANVYFNGSTVSSANIPAANLPVVWLRPTVGVGLTGGVTPGQAQLGIGNLQVWGQDKY